MEKMASAAAMLLTVMMCSASNAAPTHLVTFRGVVGRSDAPLDADVHVGDPFVATLALDAGSLFPTPAAPWTFSSGTYSSTGTMDAHVYKGGFQNGHWTEFLILTPGAPPEPRLVVTAFGTADSNPFPDGTSASLLQRPLLSAADFATFSLFIELTTDGGIAQPVYGAISTMEVAAIPEPAIAMSSMMLLRALAMRRSRRS